MTPRHRLFVLTDIENEPDDTQSLVRLLLYSNEIDIEGVVAVTSTWLRKKVHPDSIRKVIDAYDVVRPNLLRVSPDYPETSALLALVGESVAKYGMDGVGEGFDSDGSERLIKAVDRVDEAGRPLHVGLWGGANCLAQALWRVRKDRSAEELEAFINKIMVYAISDQDDAGPWIRRHFPKLPFVVSVHGENVYMGSTWIAFASQPQNDLPGASGELISKEWIKQNIQIGPLGSEYPDVMYGMEGDTPSYLGCLPNGLNDPTRPDFGGWAGRYKKIFDREAEHYHDACDTLTASDGSVQRSGAATLWRWRDAVQNDFAARMQWTIEEHKTKLQLPPVVLVDGDDSGEFIKRSVKPNEILEFDASASHSPNGAKLSFRWFQYKEVDSIMPIPVEVPDFETFGTATSSKLKIQMPETTAHVAGDRMEHEGGRTFHVILEVTSEGGKFPLTRYRRLMLDLRP